MSVPTLYDRATAAPGFLEPLPDELTVPQLAELRASSLDGLNHELCVRLMDRMEAQIRRGHLQVVGRPLEKPPTGDYIGTREVRRSAFGPIETEAIIQTWPMGGAPAGAVPRTETVEVHYVTRAAATALYALDSTDWGDGGRAWIGASGPIEVGFGVTGGTEVDPAAVGVPVVVATGTVHKTPAEQPCVTALIKTRLSARKGNLFNRSGKLVKLDQLFQNKELIAFARRNKPLRGGASLWSEHDVLAWLSGESYHWSLDSITSDDSCDKAKPAQLDDVWRKPPAAG